MFGHPGKDGSLWVSILEKAFAKYHGNYSHIKGGSPQHAIRTLLGGPYHQYKHNVADSHSADALWEKLRVHDENNDIMTASSHAGSDKDKDDKGLVQGHAYTVIGVKKLSNNVKLVKLRNPWGVDSWRGDWGHDSPLWTPKILEEVGEK